MKISKISIHNYQQFKDFTLDLTYPAGHPKAGQALDKVCFIGQNGTGKTTILNVIQHMLSQSIQEKQLLPGDIAYSFGIEFFYPFSPDSHQSVIAATASGVGYVVLDSWLRRNLGSEFAAYHRKRKIDLVSIPAEMIDWNLSKQISNPLDYVKPEADRKAEIKSELEALRNKRVFDFRTDNPTEIWKAILSDVTDDLLKEYNYTRQVAEKLLKEKC